MSSMHIILPSDTTASSGALFLGSVTAALDSNTLRANSISHIVRALTSIELRIFFSSDSEQPGCTCHVVDIDDRSTVDIGRHLEGTCAFIHENLSQGRNVLVHCQKGISRSASFVLAYLIRYRGMTYNEAYRLVKKERAIIRPNPGFARALRQWEEGLLTAGRSAEQPSTCLSLDDGISVEVR